MASIKSIADYYKDTKFFCQHNVNPTYVEGKRYKKGDCVIRAFAVAANITWLEAFDLLAENARKTFDVPNGQTNYEKVFADFGFKRMSVKVVKGKKRMTVEEFCKAHTKGNFVVRVASHMTAVVDGICYDEWNPANKCVYLYYELKKNK